MNEKGRSELINFLISHSEKTMEDYYNFVIEDGGANNDPVLNVWAMQCEEIWTCRIGNSETIEIKSYESKDHTPHLFWLEGEYFNEEEVDDGE